jgi:hypothetical protein
VVKRGGADTPVRQRGQALVFIVVTTVVVLLGALLFFNTAQLTTQKMKLQNTADAAAYSGALSEARDYNFSAYANRAMIANQVAVAQLVGLTSWARNLDSVYKSGPFTWVPQTFASLSALGSVWTTQWNIAKAAAGGIHSVVNNVAPILIKALNFWIDALSLGTSAYHLATMLEVWLETIPTVIRENDPNSQLSLSLTQVGFGVKHGIDYWNFTSQYDPQIPLAAAHPDRPDQAHTGQFRHAVHDDVPQRRHRDEGDRQQQEARDRDRARRHRPLRDSHGLDLRAVPGADPDTAAAAAGLRGGLLRPGQRLFAPAARQQQFQPRLRRRLRLDVRQPAHDGARLDQGRGRAGKQHRQQLRAEEILGRHQPRPGDLDPGRGPEPERPRPAD